MNFAPGLWKTVGGFRARVAKLIQSAGEWVLRGAVESPKDGALYLHQWHLDGRSQSGQEKMNLKEKWEENNESRSE